MGISIIIPAFNEAENIQPLLKTLFELRDDVEILVVNDGSEDKTAKVVTSAGIRVISLSENKGKSYAMLQGLRNTSGHIVLFLDADLVGITKNQLENMYKPIIKDEADMTIGIFNSGRNVTDLAQRITPFLSGQRAIKRVFLGELNEDEWTTGYGIEIALTRYARKHKLRVLNIPLKNVTHPTKEEKLGLAKGIAARMKMYWEITKEIGRI